MRCRIRPRMPRRVRAPLIRFSKYNSLTDAQENGECCGSSQGATLPMRFRIADLYSLLRKGALVPYDRGRE